MRRQSDRPRLDERALRAKDRDRVVHHGRPIGGEWRDDNARAFECVRVEEARVVPETIARRQTRPGRRIVRIEAGDDTEHDRGICHRSRERTGRVLIGGDWDDPVAADQPDIASAIDVAPSTLTDGGFRDLARDLDARVRERVTI